MRPAVGLLLFYKEKSEENENMKTYKIAVAGTGYVGLSLSVLLAQHNQVTAVDIVQAKVDMINNHKSPIQDDYMPKFELYTGENHYAGCLSRELTLFRPSYNIDCNGWRIEGNFWEWDYDILDAYGHVIAIIDKELWNWTDTYTIDVANPNDALCVLMVVLAIDAEKCSRDNH